MFYSCFVSLVASFFCCQVSVSAFSGKHRFLGRDGLDTSLQLFFQPKKEKKDDEWRIPSTTVSDLMAGITSLPISVTLEQGRKRGETMAQPPILRVRLVQKADISEIVRICVEEYGNGSIPFSSMKVDSILEWLDQLGLRFLVDWTTRLKVPNEQLPIDHAVVVATIDKKLVGMIEVSRQPVIPERNPPPYPFPLFLKQLFCQLSDVELQGWITNLLVVPKFRGLGYSKLLVAASESIAESWKCTSIHLHCDARDTLSTGRIPQKLYSRLGYEMLRDTNLSWMDANSSIFLIQGVPLLYLKKVF